MAVFFHVAEDLPGRLTIMPCPNGASLQDEIASYADAGINRIVSFLTKKDCDELGVTAEAQICADAEIAFQNFPIPDFGLPDKDAFLNLVVQVAAFLRSGENVALHCRAGVGRSGMGCAAVLMAHGMTADAAIAQVSAARGVSIPDTMEQKRFILDLANAAQSLSKPA